MTSPWPQKEAARLTAYIRVFGNVSDPEEVEDAAVVTREQDFQTVLRRQKLAREQKFKGQSSENDVFSFGSKLKLKPILNRRHANPDDPQFFKLTKIHPKSSQPQADGLSFDLDQIEAQKKALVNEDAPFDDRFTVEWLEEQIKVQSAF